MPNQALIDAHLLAATDRDRRAGNGAQPPPPSRQDGPGTRPVVAISWVLVAVMLVAIAVLALTG